MSGTRVVRNDEQSRYEVWVDGEIAGFTQVRRHAGLVIVVHTEVGATYEGQGVGSALARGALDDIRADGLSVRPYCPFVRSWIDRHPDYADLVDPAWTPPS